MRLATQHRMKADEPYSGVRAKVAITAPPSPYKKHSSVENHAPPLLTTLAVIASEDFDDAFEAAPALARRARRRRPGKAA
ncbi:MAG: hypothetical protein JOZ29_17095 [Deltaproteobacteria bacterium]|nr:hypothetical protein [Deltaproteobacteria bacterium]